MKLALHSDLHMEFGEDLFIPDLDKYADVDVLILAGDIHHAAHAPRWIDENFGGLGKPIIYIAGNHEFYHGDWDNSLAYLKTECAKYHNIHFLEDDCWLHAQGVRFIGASLWTDFNLLGNQKQDRAIASDRMNDYRKISHESNPFKTLSVLNVIERHGKSIQTITRTLADKPKGVIDIVITHHAPHEKSIHEDYVDRSLMPCYATNQEDLMLEYAPEYWLHGHIHIPAKYKVGKTQVLSNPSGYPMDRFRKTDPLIIQL